LSNPDGLENFPDHGPNVFRPGALWRSVNSAAGLLIVALGVTLPLAPAALSGWVVIGSILIVLVGGIVAVRAQFASVAFTSDRVRVRGVLYSRTIPRKQILAVDTGLSMPTISWKTSRGMFMMTPLTVLSIGSRSVLPESAFPRTQKFVSRLRSWAH
jgi:hypothetical protein